MSFRNTLVRIGSLTQSDNGVSTLEIPRGFLLRDLLLKLSGTVDVQVNPATAVVAEAPYTLIQRLEIIADGRETIKSLTGAQLRALTHLYYGGVPQFLAPLLPVALQPFNAFAIVPFANMLARSPIDTLLDTRKYQQLILRVTWGVGDGAAGIDTDLYDVPAGTITVCNATLDVHAWQTAEPSRELFSVNRQTFMEQVYTAATADLDFRIPTGNIIRSILIKTMSGDRLSGVGLIPRDDMLNFVSLIADGAHKPIERAAAATIQAWNGNQFRGVDPASTVGLRAPTGYYLVDFGEDGMMSAAIQSIDIASLILKLDVNLIAATTNRVQIVLNEIIPAPVADVTAAAIG